MDMRALFLNIAQKCFNRINPELSNYSSFSGKLSSVIKEKENQNIQYSFDVELDQLIKKELASISARVFSEESGWFETTSNYDYKIIYDPFCNSSLASRSFREAAMGISIFKADNTWIVSAILDYQTGLVGYVESGSETKFFQAQTLKEISISKSVITELSDSWSVVTLENIHERSSISGLLPMVQSVGRLIISSGHIYWLRLAMGTVNIYTDPIGGEELYEMFACTVAQGSGCIVTDLEGNDFNPTQMLTKFEADKHYSFKPVAASSPTLHQKLLNSLQGPTL